MGTDYGNLMEVESWKRRGRNKSWRNMNSRMKKEAEQRLEWKNVGKT